VSSSVKTSASPANATPLVNRRVLRPAAAPTCESRAGSGLIKDYYRARAIGFLDQALLDAAKGQPLDTKATDQMMATLAYTFQLGR
jgi:hypothetical protein